MNWTDLFAALIVAAAPAVWAVVKTWVTPQRVAQVTDIARVAVRGAEKLGADMGATSPDKLTFACDVLTKGARRLGIRLTENEALALVHQALAEFEAVKAA